MGGRVAAVRPGSPADVAGIVRGDVVVSADGHTLTDVIDWRWHSCDARVAVVVARGDAELELHLSRESGDWGIDFEEAVFDGIRTCENACEFCFVSQLPPGLRPALYVRDDDFRLSFLAGNFITMTNLDANDEARIIEQRLSPLHVSVHAIDPEVRHRLLRCRGADRALETLERLLAHGIEAHAQVVLVPGVNDGAVLERTLDWLEAHDGIASVGIVPLGFTAHQSRYRSSFDAVASGRLLATLDARRLRRLDAGLSRWVHAADEFFLSAGCELPEDGAYEGYPQLENGIGLVRLFVETWDDIAPKPWERPTRLVTGELFAPVLARKLADTSWSHVTVLAVPNRFFGGGVSVAGLLTGDDLASTIKQDAGRSDRDLPTYLVPDIVLNEDGLTLDDLTADEVVARAGCDLRFVPTEASSFLATMSGSRRKA